MSSQMSTSAAAGSSTSSSTPGSLCQTCSSSIASTSAYHTPCCGQPICARCLAKNPRLREYDPCLRCGDLTTASGIDRVRLGRHQAQRAREQRENVFQIGGDEDEDTADEPPPYDAEQASKPEDVETHGQAQKDTDMEEVEVRHPVARSDTILAIARRYGADPHDIIKLNDLPHSVLSSQPHLLRTRKTLVISRRLVPKSQIPSSTLFDSGPSDPDHDHRETDSLEAQEEQERQRRERERAVKRFQLMTKSVDPSIGDAYIALSELDEANVDYLSSLEVDQATTGEDKGKRPLPSARNREQRALDAFYDDENWESAMGKPQRSKQGGWKTVGSASKMGVKV